MVAYVLRAMVREQKTERIPELMIMAELDGTPNAPLTPLEAATINRNYLQNEGYAFRSKT